MSSCGSDKTCTCGAECNCGSGCGGGKMYPETTAETLVHGVGPQKTHTEGGAGEMNAEAENGGCKCNPCTCNPCTCK